MISRVLPPSEWKRLETVPMPTMLDYVRPEDIDVCVVEDADRIVACWSVLRVVHLEGVWVDPAYRKAGVVRGLIRKAFERAADGGRRWAFTGADDDRVRRIIERIGGRMIPMDTWVLPLNGGA